MSVKIRLTRRGRNKTPFYRIVVADTESPRDGKFLEILGTYDPLKDPVEVKFSKERVMEWYKRGARPSETVRSILLKQGLKL
ncbi:MAG: 30S ribosomal protein S16 [Thermodesulfobacteriota bacterium]